MKYCLIFLGILFLLSLVSAQSQENLSILFSINDNGTHYDVVMVRDLNDNVSVYVNGVLTDPDSFNISDNAVFEEIKVLNNEQLNETNQEGANNNNIIDLFKYLGLGFGGLLQALTSILLRLYLAIIVIIFISSFFVVLINLMRQIIV